MSSRTPRDTWHRRPYAGRNGQRTKTVAAHDRDVVPAATSASGNLRGVVAHAAAVWRVFAGEIVQCIMRPDRSSQLAARVQSTRSLRSQNDSRRLTRLIDIRRDT